MIALLSDTTVDPLAWTLIHSLWQVTAIAIVTAGVLRLVPRQNGRLRYRVAAFALFAAVATSVGTFTWLSSAHPAELATNERLARWERSNVATDIAAWTPPAELTLPFTLPDELVGPGIAPSVDPSTELATWPRWIAELWMLGVACLALRLAFSLYKVRTLYTRDLRPLPLFHRELVQQLANKLCVRVPVRAFASVRVQVPLVIGWLRPRILLPTGALLGLTPSQLEAILIHEIAHIRRFDYLVNLLQTAIETLFFFHPAVWWISNALRIEREHCCDDVASLECGSIVYARALASLETLRQVAPRPALAATDGSLVERIRRVLTTPTPRSPRPGAGWFSVLLITTIMVGLGLHVRADNPFAGAAEDPLTKIEESLDPLTLGSPNASPEDVDVVELPEDFFDLPGAFSGGGDRVTIEASAGTKFSRFRGRFLDPDAFDSGQSSGNVTDPAAFAVPGSTRFSGLNVGPPRYDGPFDPAAKPTLDPTNAAFNPFDVPRSSLGTDPTNKKRFPDNPVETKNSPLSLDHGKVLSTVKDGRYVVVSGNKNVTVGDRYVFFRASRYLGQGTVVSGADDLAIITVDQSAKGGAIRVGDAVAKLLTRSVTFPVDESSDPSTIATKSLEQYLEFAKKLDPEIVLDVRPVLSADRKYITLDVQATPAANAGQAAIDPAGITLDVRPEIAPDGAGITLDIDPESVSDKWKHSVTKIPNGAKPTAGGDMTIVAVKNDVDLVVVSGGSEDGLKVGSSLTVYRGDRYIATIKIIRTTPDLAGCRIVNTQPDGIMIGDSVDVTSIPKKQKVDAFPHKSGVATVNGVSPNGRFVGLDDGEQFKVGQQLWIRRGKQLIAMVEVLESTPATTRVRLVSPDHKIEIGDRAVSKESLLHPSQTSDDPAPYMPGKTRYRVRAGDSLQSIAEKQLGNSDAWQTIRRMNPDADTLDVGRDLWLPAKATTRRR